MKQAELRCQVYLVVPVDAERSHIGDVISCDAFDTVSSVLLRSTDDGCNEDVARDLLAACHDADIPLLIENDAAFAKKIGADGVHVTGHEDDLANVRATLGDDTIVGAACDATRHMAMSLTEQGADYIAFAHDNPDELAQLIEWWSDVTVVPCIAWNVTSLEIAGQMADAGADFASFETFVWSHSKGPVTALREIKTALSRDKAAA